MNRCSDKFKTHRFACPNCGRHRMTCIRCGEQSPHYPATIRLGHPMARGRGDLVYLCECSENVRPTKKRTPDGEALAQVRAQVREARERRRMNNLPPGVSENMIPGNRPEDLDDESFWEAIVGKVGIEAFEAFDDALFHQKDSSLWKLVNAVRELSYQTGFQEGQAEAQLDEAAKHLDS